MDAENKEYQDRDTHADKDAEDEAKRREIDGSHVSAVQKTMSQSIATKPEVGPRSSKSSPVQDGITEKKRWEINA